MGKYLIKVCYSTEGIKGVRAEGGSSRVQTVRRLIESVGGTLECFYFAFGDTDVYIIVDVPDASTAMSLASAVGSSEAISSYETVVLVDAEEVDAAAKMSVGYRAPGA